MNKFYKIATLAIVISLLASIFNLEDNKILEFSAYGLVLILISMLIFKISNIFILISSKKKIYNEIDDDESIGILLQAKKIVREKQW